MSRREKGLVTMVIVLGLLFSASMGLIVVFGREYEDLDRRVEGLKQEVSQTKDSLAVLEPFRAEELQTDEDVFNVLMSEFEQSALLGEWPAGQTFDESVLPYLYKFYVASSLGYMPKEVAFSYVLRARNFVGEWPVTFATAKYSVEALYYQIMYEINNPVEEGTEEGEQI